MPETYIPFVAPAGGEGPILYQKSPAVRKRLKRGLPCYPAVLAEEVGKAGGQGALAQGSCLALCAALRERGVKADLVYIDPPFASGVDYSGQIHLRPVPGRSPLPGASFAHKFYGDIWDRGVYLDWMYENLLAIKGILKDTGSIYVHLDWHIGHYVKVLLDEIFGAENFQREIIWRIGWVSGFKSAGNNWVRNHDTIFYYTMGPKATFHKAYLPYPDGYVRRDGKPPKGKGIPLEDTWNCSEGDRLDSIQIQSFSGEKAGYATQKPQALLRRIISASSNPGDLVCDLFGGSGVTAAAAHSLGRRFVHGDGNPRSLQTARDRLVAQGAAFDIWRLEEDGPVREPGHQVALHREGKRVRVARFFSPQVAEQVTARNARAKKNPLPLDPSGLDCLEYVSLDCTSAQGPWHSAREVVIDRRGLATLDGKATRARWDGTLAGPKRPLRVKLRDILGRESIWTLD